MAKTIDDLIRNMELLEQEVIKSAPAIADEVASDAMALVINRIQTDGLEGKQYSTNAMLATQSQFNRKAAFKQSEIEETRFHRDKEGKVTEVKGNRKKVVKRLLWIKFPGATKAVPVMVLAGGYKQLREIQGLPVNHVDLTYSGRMFQNTKIVKAEKEGLKFLSIIGATNAEEKQKLAGNQAHYGNFLAPNQKEAALIAPVPINRLRELFKKVLG